MSSIGILEFNKYNAIIKHGYDIGLRLAREWKAENPDAAALLEQEAIAEVWLRGQEIESLISQAIRI